LPSWRTCEPVRIGQTEFGEGIERVGRPLPTQVLGLDEAESLVQNARGLGQPPLSQPTLGEETSYSGLHAKG
jgi:hypothetical protein